jgi:hypothetical protein
LNGEVVAGEFDHAAAEIDMVLVEGGLVRHSVEQFIPVWLKMPGLAGRLNFRLWRVRL